MIYSEGIFLQVCFLLINCFIPLYNSKEADSCPYDFDENGR